MIGLPRTGRTTSYQPGDDGDLQKGRRFASARAEEFRDNGDGTISDIATGLMWMKNYIVPILGDVTPEMLAIGNKATSATGRVYDHYTPATYAVGEMVYLPEQYNNLYAGYYICILAHTTAVTPDQEFEEGEPGYDPFCYPPIEAPSVWRWCPFAGDNASLTTAATFAWDQALMHIDWLNLGMPMAEYRGYAGYTDWRMPNPMEMMSIFNFEQWGHGGLYMPHFASRKDGYHWTGATYKPDANRAYVTAIGNDMVPCTHQPKTLSFPFRPVRGGR